MAKTIQWTSEIEPAFEKARKEAKLLLLDFSHAPQ